MLLGTGSPEDTRRSIESVSRQLYPHWDLFVPGEPESEDPRIHAAPWNGTTGDLVVFLRAGDELTEHALFLLAGESDADLVYADEDSLDDQGRLYDPVFKPDWNPDLFLSTNYLGRAWAVRRARVTEAGGHARDPFEVLVRAVGSPWTIRHVPFVICHRSAADPPEAHAAAVRVLQRHLGDAAAVEPGPFPGTQRVRWKLPESPPLVSLIIPTRDGRELLEPCVESLIAQTAYRNFEILIVDNGSSDPDALDYLANLERRGTARVLRSDRPFNFSALNNLAVAEARGEVVGLLNNDLEFIEPEWLGEMVSHALRPEVGAVGARLLYPDRTVQHVGVILGIGGVADHVHKHLPADAPGYCGRARLTQDFSAVTAACLLVRRKTYLEVGGLDERFAVAFNDVDFCLRIRDRGLRNVWTPYATVVHHESKSRGLDRTPARVLRFRGEIALLKSRWGRSLLEDPAYNPNLTLDAKNVALAWPPRVSPPWRRG